MSESSLNNQSQEIRHAPTQEKKLGQWYLLTGLLIGILLGLAFTWLIWPVVYVDTTPASLSNSYKAIYRGTIAQTYAATGNLERAVSRLALLENEDIVFALGAQAQAALADGRSAEAHALALLASAIQANQTP